MWAEAGRVGVVGCGRSCPRPLGARSECSRPRSSRAPADPARALATDDFPPGPRPCSSRHRCGTPSPAVAPRPRAARRGGFQSACRRTSVVPILTSLWPLDLAGMELGGQPVDLTPGGLARGLGYL